MRLFTRGLRRQFERKRNIVSDEQILSDTFDEMEGRLEGEDEELTVVVEGPKQLFL